ncbi:MAG: macro domain-containing protein, partial [Cyanobacteria bacterium J06648_11]
MDTPALRLVDVNPAVVDAWRSAFRRFTEVSISHGDILEHAICSVVSPANSYGFMDGGIDAIYTRYFGLRPQTELQEIIARREDQKLPVGSGVLIRTGHDRIPFLISAPTMETPGPVPKQNAFYAMSAVLNTLTKHKDKLTEVYCPGLCTDVGHVEPEDAATEMAFAY